MIDVAEHRRFCEIEGWSIRTGARHDVAVLTLADGRVLRTAFEHGNKGDYGDDLRTQVLRQLEVDQSTFDSVLRSGDPPARPAPVPVHSSSSRSLTAFDQELLRHGCLSPREVLDLTPEETQHIAYQLWSAELITDCAERRLKITSIVEEFRSG